MWVYIDALTIRNAIQLTK